MIRKQLNADMRIKDLSESGSFSGYGSIFNVIDLHKDIVEPGAFSASLQKHAEKGTMPSMLWQHQMPDVVGMYTTVKEDDQGLYLEGDLFLNQRVPEADKAYTLMKHGAVRGLSIGFTVPKGGEKYDDSVGAYRISEIDLVEVSIVTQPANTEANVVAVKAAIDGCNPREIERILRDAGFSASRAKKLMSGGFKALTGRDDPEYSCENEAILSLIGQISQTSNK